jgi:hypothetical protein
MLFIAMMVLFEGYCQLDFIKEREHWIFGLWFIHEFKEIESRENTFKRIYF